MIEAAKDDDVPCLIEEIIEDNREGEAKVEADASTEPGQVAMAS